MNQKKKKESVTMQTASQKKPIENKMSTKHEVRLVIEDYFED